MKCSQLNIIAASLLLMFAVTSCKKLSLQKDYDRTPHTLDPKLNKSAGKYLSDRATGVAAPNDTLFAWMMRGIQYAEIDLAEYEKTGKTFVFLHNDAVRRVSSNKIQPDCFFGANLVNGLPGQKWEDYPKEFVKNYLLYLIASGVHDHYTITNPEVNAEVSTLAPEGAFSALPAGITRHVNYPFDPENNPKALIRFKVLNSSPSNTSDYPIVLNDVLNVRTSSLQATNGTVHVIDRFVPPTLIQ
ncbi:hypothetical protein [Pseudoflavitalea rhizosphaerae]|uniref:hypothetical protein n=1 Tax=Pseudoflavitalea rhizosphaerae TaxID=1884793 RepID=UPI000F8E1D41|nr:hypothetical protein [Pseudoflavitalea rhizosphaerae]